MADNYRANQYKQMSIKTANRGQILIMLYEAAIKNLRLAIAAIDKKNIQDKGLYIGKAHEIIMELLNTLDFEVGGVIAQDLERLYNFMIEQMLKANLENKNEPLKPVLKIMEDLLGAWREAVKEVNQKSASPSK
ncbi:MAG: flagellar export chaperone FliS [Bdellovibrionia bacterium]